MKNESLKEKHLNFTGWEGEVGGGVYKIGPLLGIFFWLFTKMQKKTQKDLPFEILYIIMNALILENNP